MSRPALVLAAHGLRAEPEVNARIRSYAQQIERLDLFEEVSAAFHQGDPPFAEVLDRIVADEVIVVPVMASEGYYATVVLPRELARNRRCCDIAVTVTPALGTHPGMVDLVAQRVRERIVEHGLRPTMTLALIGHGTPRHAKSRDSTIAVAEGIVVRGIAEEVVCAFLDDEPPVESLRERVKAGDVIVEPFLMSDAVHTVQDIPRRMGLPVQLDARPPQVYRTSRGLTICNAAIGADERIVEVILALCRESVGDIRLTPR